MEATRTNNLAPRQTSPAEAAQSSGCVKTGNESVDQLLCLLSNGFTTQISTTAFFASLAISLGITLLIALLFCFLRPLNNTVYAPRARHADQKHAPPPIGKSPLSWLKPVLGTREQQLVDKIGMDATIFLRFTHMCRNIFLVLSIIGCGILIPVNLIAGRGETKSFSDIWFLLRITPQFIYGSNYFWAYVVVAYLFNIVICFFLWHNYRAVVRLRRAYFKSPEYQRSLHARTLLLSEIPQQMRSDEGIVRICEGVQSIPSDVPRGAIARNVKDLPDLVEEHEKTVRDLESVLAKYLKDPNKLPATRPTCNASKSDRSYKTGQKVDAIEYLTERIKELEMQIKQVRETVDKRNAMPYGFASYRAITNAHTTAYAARRGGPNGIKIRLAPRPHDLIWKNLHLTKKDRNWRNFVNNLWVALLTFFYIIPNVFSAVFLSNLAHLGAIWPAFNKTLYAHPTWWGIVQGIVPPALQTLFYYFLPPIFRRLSSNSGDLTKTSRERHVMHKLYSFYVFNNLLVYSLFSAIWIYIVTVIGAKDKGVWDAIKEGGLFQHAISALTTMSTFWLTWLLQRNLGAAVDLAQLLALTWRSFSRRYLSPTPRQVVELSAPQPMDYAGYYNYFLFYVTVALCYAPLQPLALPVTALYFVLDSHAKKYLLMYVLITKTESGGKFWRALFNRMVFAALLGNIFVALVVGAQGTSWIMLVALAPLPFLLLAFKLYCARAYDDLCGYYTTKPDQEAEETIATDTKTKGHDRVGVRFGHPVLYKPLITPMVHAKAQHMLRSIYSGRTSLDYDNNNASGYSDGVYMDSMSRDRPGQTEKPAPFEIVDESQLDFANFKNRAEFRDQLGGEGELYGRPADQLRRGSETSTMTGFTNPAGYANSRSRSQSRDSERTRVDGGTTYPSGYHKASSAGLRDHSVDSSRSVDVSGLERVQTHEDRGRLLGGAARMGRSPPPAPTPSGAFRAYSPSNRATPGEDDTSYDYFRRGRGG